MNNILIGCLSKEVSSKVKSGIHEIAELSLSKVEEIEAINSELTPNDRQLIQLAKNHANQLKSFADSLESCTTD